MAEGRYEQVIQTLGNVAYQRGDYLQAGHLLNSLLIDAPTEPLQSAARLQDWQTAAGEAIKRCP
ncbi:MAG: hypothetical protein KDI62_15715 [Anaerolineae bacterium]|nr:hypothetical protein [Anaerolineae bacterium]MCB0179679.1 hypothetical protein [Anaerolineae bacterium]MCB9103786.1 hypothetical protein [Anaerolineales bacterium]